MMQKHKPLGKAMQFDVSEQSTIVPFGTREPSDRMCYYSNNKQSQMSMSITEWIENFTWTTCNMCCQGNLDLTKNWTKVAKKASIYMYVFAEVLRHLQVPVTTTEALGCLLLDSMWNKQKYMLYEQSGESESRNERPLTEKHTCWAWSVCPSDACSTKFVVHVGVC